MKAGRYILLAALVALLQIGFLGWMIAGRAAVLRDGREVVLKVEPIDPRDLLRGDYVRLGYDIAQIPASSIDNLPIGSAIAEKATIYVRLTQSEGGIWTLKRASLGAPLATPAEPHEVDLRGLVRSRIFSSDDRAVIRPDYGIERFYLPEGEGRQIEIDMRERPFFVKLAVASDGTAQIKQFLDGDKVLYSEPLY